MRVAVFKKIILLHSLFWPAYHNSNVALYALLCSKKFNCLQKNLLAQPAMDKFLRDSTYNQLLLANVPINYG